MYVDIPFKYMTDDKEVQLGKGCIWQNLHRWNRAYGFDKAFKNYNPDNNLV